MLPLPRFATRSWFFGLLTLLRSTWTAGTSCPCYGRPLEPEAVDLLLEVARGEVPVDLRRYARVLVAHDPLDGRGTSVAPRLGRLKKSRWG
jgi:hypothetical protein